VTVFGYEITVTGRRLPCHRWNENWKAGFWVGWLFGFLMTAIVWFSFECIFK
jgi:hypothetical protein